MRVKLSLKVLRIATQTGKGAVVGSVFRAEARSAILKSVFRLEYLIASLSAERCGSTVKWDKINGRVKKLGQT
jgi:hypothetical protein